MKVAAPIIAQLVEGSAILVLATLAATGTDLELIAEKAVVAIRL